MPIAARTALRMSGIFIDAAPMARDISTRRLESLAGLLADHKSAHGYQPGALFLCPDLSCGLRRGRAAGLWSLPSRRGLDRLTSRLAVGKESERDEFAVRLADIGKDTAGAEVLEVA